MDFEKLDAIAAAFMKNKRFHSHRETGSVYYHGKRVSRGVLRLREAVTKDISHDDILRCAAMFHDVAKGMSPHSHYGAIIVKEALKDELPEYEMGEVCRLIEAHGDRRPAIQTHDMWVWLLQDADILDHTGSYEIWLACTYYAYEQRPMEDILEWYPCEFNKEMQKYRNRLNLDVSRSILDGKIAFERKFIDRLRIEVTGDYVPGDIDFRI